VPTVMVFDDSGGLETITQENALRLVALTDP
jgi:hypothetical protein